MEHRAASPRRPWRGNNRRLLREGRLQTPRNIRSACDSKYVHASKFQAVAVGSQIIETLDLTRVLRTAFKTPPFRIQEEGWGEFDMLLVLTPKDKGADISVGHDLNFQSEHYETKHPIVSLCTSNCHGL